MSRAVPGTQEQAHLVFDKVTMKELLRDLLFREAGQLYFKRLALPRRYRWLGAWRTLATYDAERQLLPVGGRDLDQHIARFFATHACLRVEFQAGGMPVSAIRVLRVHCPAVATTLERIAFLECRLEADGVYRLVVCGGPALASDQPLLSG